MATKLAEAYVEITAKSAGLDSELAGVQSKLGGFSDRVGGLLAGAAAGLAAAGIGDILRNAVEAGADLGETMNKVQTTFGNSTGIITGMATDMANQFGAVRGVTLDAAAIFGLIAQGAGLSEQASAKLSEKLVRLADDASSFFNKPLDVALQKIRSGLVGEAEPLREFGVLLSEAAVKQQALAMGFEPVNGAFSEQEKVLARVEIITKSLAKVQGDHLKTMDSYKQQVKSLSGEWENMKADAGAPMAAGLASVMSTFRKEGLMAAIGKFTMNAAANPLQANTGEDVFGNAADVAAGVQKGLKGITDGRSIQDELRDPNSALSFLRGRAADEAAMNAEREDRMAKVRARMAKESAAEFDAKKFTGAGFGAFGMFGNLGQDLNRQGMVAGMDQQIADRQAAQAAWGGGHVMDSLAFLKSAQEKILQPTDETAKKSLDELVKIREAVSKTEPKAGGVILKGREH